MIINANTLGRYSYVRPVFKRLSGTTAEDDFLFVSGIEFPNAIVSVQLVRGRKGPRRGGTRCHSTIMAAGL